jgi:phosphomannomutase
MPNPDLINEKKKKVVIFDLDGTLAESKQPLDYEMAALLGNLLAKVKVAIISGGGFSQFEKQFLGRLPLNPKLYSNLFLFPASGTIFYRFDEGRWNKIYSETLSEEDKLRIKGAILGAEEKLGFAADTLYGEKIEDRESQVTYSALGQEAPLGLKKDWDPDQEKRKKMVELMLPTLPDFTVTIGGTTSIDITPKGVDKAYGVKQIEKTLSVPISEMLFVGDKLEPGGNDAAVKVTGIETFAVANVAETKNFIQEFLDDLED